MTEQRLYCILCEVMTVLCPNEYILLFKSIEFRFLSLTEKTGRNMIQNTLFEASDFNLFRGEHAWTPLELAVVCINS